MDSDVKPIQGKKRKLSKFLCDEMLYDYSTGNLDEQRASSVKEFLSTSEESKKVLENINSAMNYCETLAKTELSQDLVSDLTASQSIFSWVVNKIRWKNWPEVTKWTIEAFAISGIVAFIVAVSWPKVSKWFPQHSSDVILAEVEKSEAPKKIESEKGILLNEKGKVPDPKDVGDKKASDTVIPDEAPMSAEKVEEKEPEGQEIADVQDETKIAAAPEPKEKPEKEKPALKGFLYRAKLSISDIDARTETFRQKLIERGGKKAGNVKLGWKKETGSYFHFSINESEYDFVVSELRSFGPVRIFKVPHWRVMPEGKIRFIIDLDDADLKP